jgi:hypothetical protein
MHFRNVTRHFMIMLAGVAMFFISSAAAAESNAPASAGTTATERFFASLDETVQEFAITCMAQDFADRDLHTAFDKSPQATVWPDALAKPFLAGAPGTVWGVKGRSSNYAIAVIDTGASRGICSVSAERPVAGAWDDFEILLRNFFPDTELVPVSPEMAGPQMDSIKAKGYRLRKNGQLLAPIFTMMSTTEPKFKFSDRLTVYFPGYKDWLRSGAAHHK